MKPTLSLSAALAAVANYLVRLPLAGATISLGHDAVNNYAWITGLGPCKPVLISPYGSAECGVEFDITINIDIDIDGGAGGDGDQGDQGDVVTTYRLEHCGEAGFQLQEHAGGDGWAVIAYCEPAPQGGGRMDCSSASGQGSVLEEWRCG